MQYPKVYTVQPEGEGAGYRPPPRPQAIHVLGNLS